jgi:glycine oxidase
MPPHIAIVGGGIMGASIALRLCREGMKVTVLERSIPGAEASSAAAGILGTQLEAEGPGPFLDLCLASRERYPAFVEEIEAKAGMGVGYWRCGALVAAFDVPSAQKLEETVRWQRGLGLKADLLTSGDARALEPNLGPGATRAAHFPDDHQVDNRLLIRALGIAAERSGARYRAGTIRTILERGGRAVGVDVDGERLEADAVVVAAGAWTGLVPGAQIAASAVKPARGQMVELQARVPLLNRVVASSRGYLVPRADGRIIAGSTVEHVGFEKVVTAQGLSRILQMAVELCPALADVPVQQTWAGLRPFTNDHLPILGPGPLESLFVASGHFRNGILLAPITAEILASLVLGRASPLPLAPFSLQRQSV